MLMLSHPAIARAISELGYCVGEYDLDLDSDEQQGGHLDVLLLASSKAATSYSSQVGLGPGLLAPSEGSFPDCPAWKPVVSREEAAGALSDKLLSYSENQN